MNPKIKLIVLSLVFVFSTLSFALAQSVPELAQKALAATVSLEMQDENGNTLGQGSGFFVRRNLIATNFHVIDGAAKGYARLVNTAITYPIEGVTATDETNDLALLKVTVHGILPLELGDSNAVQIGETVYVAGNPLGFEGTFSDGIISGRRDSATKKERLQMTAPISPGSSGGTGAQSEWRGDWRVHVSLQSDFRSETSTSLCPLNLSKCCYIDQGKPCRCRIAIRLFLTLRTCCEAMKRFCLEMLKRQFKSLLTLSVLIPMMSTVMFVVELLKLV